MTKYPAVFILLLLGDFFTWDCYAVSQDGLPPSPLNTLLTCYIPNPFAGQPGENDSIPENTIRLLLQPPARDDDSVWMPLESGFRRPPGKVDQQLLIQFVGADFNMNLQAIDRPTGMAPNAFQFIPLEGLGSGGQPRGFFQEEPRITPPRLDELSAANRTIIQSYLTQIGGREGLGNCPLVSEWTSLPDTYFPRWYSAGRCSGSSCSLPEGLTCEPDIGEDRLVYLTVVRWDCCWSFIEQEWKWNCGWRKVRIPVIADCHCGCDARVRQFTDPSSN